MFIKYTLTYNEMASFCRIIGNSYNFTWTNGRRLATATKGSDTLSFTYNDEGIRTSKTVNGVVHTYYLNGTQILAEEWGTELLIYLYDAEGSPIGMQYRNASWYKKDAFDTYWFEKNLHGDIIGVYTAKGLKVCSYVYDAWGNFKVIMDYDNGVGSGDAQAVGYNPFRYRGYYYDQELGMYYLQSRYYDPVICRFINADGYVNANGGILGFNMYAYCNNNPVMRIDPNGEFFVSITLICVAAFAAVGATAGGVIGYKGARSAGVDDKDLWKYTIGGVVIGGVVGGVAGYVAAPASATATGIAGVSVTSSGIAVVGAGGVAAEQIIENASTALQTYYPPNNGFSGVPEKITLEAGTILQRTGDLVGRFVAPAGTPTQMLSLPYDKIGQATTYLEVMQPVQALGGRVAPWFGQIGCGIQYLLLDGRVDELIRDGVIRIFGG